MIILGFTSCSGSNTIATSSSRRTSTSRNTSSSSSDEDEKDDGDPCKGSDSCEETCDRIYGDYSEVQKCEDEGRDKVGRLDKVYKHLKSGKYNELLDISEEDNDVDMDDFEEYLELGVTGWTDLIEEWGDGTPEPSKLIDTLQWLIDKTSVSEVLQDSDDGLDVLEKILIGFNSVTGFDLKAHNIITSDNNHANLNTGGSNAQNCGANNQHNYHTGHTASNKNKLYILVKGGTYCSSDPDQSSRKAVDFDTSQDRMLYRGLAYMSLDSNSENVFSYSIEKNNEAIRTMAYDLLNKVCSATSSNADKPIACRRALFCWMNIKGLINGKLDTWIENQSGLDGFDISDTRATSGDGCKPVHFHEYFD